MSSAAALDSLADFSDRLSPMVVKELRQGLRTRMFRGVLLVLHLLLILITLVAGAAENPDEVRWLLDTVSVLALCVVLPLCGFSALAGEIRGNTLETLVLTRLSAARIILGKWASLAAQSTLVAVSLAPYYVARYAFGGSEIVSELTTLAYLWLGGMVLAAAIVCLSTQKAFWLRALVVALAMLGPSMMGVMFLFAPRGIFGGTGITLFGLGSLPLGPLWNVLVPLLAVGWLTFYFLSLGATRIAPPAANLAWTKRTVHLLVVAGLVMAAWSLAAGRQQLLQTAAVVAWLASIDALIENRLVVPTPLISFYRRGFPGRVLAWFMAPGWPNGVLFSVIAVGMPTVAGALMENAEFAARLWLSCAEVWLTALVLHVSSLRRRSDLLAPYLGIAIFLMLVNSLVLMISATLAAATGTFWPGLLLPDTVIPTLEAARAAGKLGGSTVEELTYLGVMISGVWPLLLGFLAVMMSRTNKRVRVEARQLAGEAA